jgi:hypothetical protein
VLISFRVLFLSLSVSPPSVTITPPCACAQNTYSKNTEPLKRCEDELDEELDEEEEGLEEEEELEEDPDQQELSALPKRRPSAAAASNQKQPIPPASSFFIFSESNRFRPHFPVALRAP